MLASPRFLRSVRILACPTTQSKQQAMTAIASSRGRQRLQLALVSLLVPPLVALIGCTLRVEFAYEEGSIRGLDEIHPGIFPFWHNCVLPAIWIFRKRNLAVMTSRSSGWRVHCARDSADSASCRFADPVRAEARGRCWRRKPSWRTVGERPSPSTARAARVTSRSAVPSCWPRRPASRITPFYVALEKRWVLNTWDRFMIPRPFSRAFVRVARQIAVPADADEATQERCYQEMQSALERITSFAEARFSAASH